MKEFTIAENDAGQRLDRFLEKAVPLLPASLCQKYLRRKRVKVNGRAAKGDCRLAFGDRLSLYIGDEFFETPSRENAYLKVGAPRLKIVYEDEQILLADKAPGVLCHSERAGEAVSTLVTQLQAYLYQTGQWKPKEELSFTPALCNRIDRNTGGIVIAAKTAEALRVMNEKLRARELDKYYLCAVTGKPSPPAGRLTGQLFKDAAQNRVYVRERREPGTKTAVTEYRTLAVRGGVSLLECRILTGRTHQIRAQMAAFGCPLVGDGKYGGKRTVAGDENRQALCSYRLRFSFTSDAGVLNHLRGRSFSVERVEFAEALFPGFPYQSAE